MWQLIDMIVVASPNCPVQMPNPVSKQHQRCLFYVLWCRTCQLLADCGGGAGKEGKGSPCVTQHLRSPSRCTTYGDKRYTMIVLSSACQNFYKEW